MKRALLALAAFGIAAVAYAAGEPQILHKNGRKDPIDMMGAKVYDSTDVLRVAPFQVVDPNGTRLAYSGEGRLATVTGVNWNTTTLQPLYTCPANKSCYVHAVRFRAGTATSATAVCGIGWDAGGTNVVAQSTNALSTSNYIRKVVTLGTFNAAGGSLGFKCGTPE